MFSAKKNAEIVACVLLHEENLSARSEFESLGVTDNLNSTDLVYYKIGHVYNILNNINMLNSVILYRKRRCVLRRLLLQIFRIRLHMERKPRSLQTLSYRLRPCFHGEEEWQFIKTQIQQLDIPGNNEWHIGLRKGRQGGWIWVSGSPLEINKWQSSQPSGDGPVAVMAENHPPGTQGLFNDLRNSLERAFICELPKGKMR